MLNNWRACATEKFGSLFPDPAQGRAFGGLDQREAIRE
jgi:hypothetical protein